MLGRVLPKHSGPSAQLELGEVRNVASKVVTTSVEEVAIRIPPCQFPQAIGVIFGERMITPDAEVITSGTDNYAALSLALKDGACSSFVQTKLIFCNSPGEGVDANMHRVDQMSVMIDNEE